MSYRELEIFKESKRLAIEVHRISLELPKFEMYEEGGQVRRSSKSVTCMIVEGYGRRRYKADYIKYLVYSQSECDETFVHLEFLTETGSAQDIVRMDSLKIDYNTLSKRINKYIQWVEESFDPGYKVQEPGEFGYNLNA
ncbi:MAG: four helix bundle protein [Cyclobacteriaceae bacterium]